MIKVQFRAHLSPLPHPPIRFGKHCYLCFLNHFPKGPKEIASKIPAESPCKDTRFSPIGNTSAPSLLRSPPAMGEPYSTQRLGPLILLSPA